MIPEKTTTFAHVSDSLMNKATTHGT